MKDKELRKELYALETAKTALRNLILYPSVFDRTLQIALDGIEIREKQLCKELDRIAEERRLNRPPVDSELV